MTYTAARSMAKINFLWWSRPPASLIYGLTVLSVGIALLIASWMDVTLQSAAHVSLFLCAVMFSAWLGGVKAASLAGALSTVAFDYYFLPPIYSLVVEINQLPRLLIFALSAFFVGWLSAAQRSAAQSLGRARDELHETLIELERINDVLQTENTERRRAEDALRKSESYLAEAQILSQTGSFGWNPSTGEIFWSEQTHRIAGYDLTIKPSFELVLQRVHPEDRALVQKTLDRANQDETDLDFEHRFLLPDGSIKHVHVLAHAARHPSGSIEFVGAVMDITARRRAEDELRKSEKEYRDLVDLSPDAIYLVDAENKLVSANPAGLELLRCRAQDVAGMPVSETYLPEERSVYRTRVEQLKTGAALRFERTFVRKDGSQVPVEVSTSSMHHGYSQVVVRDIGERKQAEAKLRRSEAYLAEAQKLSRTGSWACTADCLQTTYWSAEMFRIMGLPPRENPLSSVEIAQYLDPESSARLIALFESARAKKTGCDGEFAIILPDGSNRTIRIVGHPVLDAGGNLVEFVGTTIDVTEQHQARAALEKAFAEIKKSEDQLRVIIDTIPALAWSTLPDGSAEFVNQRWHDYTGLAEETQDWDWSIAIHRDDLIEVMEKWRALLAYGEPGELEARLRRFDGEYRWFLFRAAPLRDQTGNIS